MFVLSDLFRSVGFWLLAVVCLFALVRLDLWLVFVFGGLLVFVC